MNSLRPQLVCYASQILMTNQLLKMLQDKKSCFRNNIYFPESMIFKLLEMVKSHVFSDSINLFKQFNLQQIYGSDRNISLFFLMCYCMQSLLIDQ